MHNCKPTLLDVICYHNCKPRLHIVLCQVECNKIASQADMWPDVHVYTYVPMAVHDTVCNMLHSVTCNNSLQREVYTKVKLTLLS